MIFLVTLLLDAATPACAGGWCNQQSKQQETLQHKSNRSRCQPKPSLMLPVSEVLWQSKVCWSQCGGPPTALVSLKKNNNAGTNMQLGFHSHFADKSDQDATTTNQQHMNALVKHFMKKSKVLQTEVEQLLIAQTVMPSSATVQWPCTCCPCCHTQTPRNL